MAARRSVTPRRVPVQRRSRETVRAVLDAAARVVAERGVAGATTNAIARVAGVSVGSLYEYFPNKEALLVALAERLQGRMAADAAEGVAGLAASRDLDEALQRFAETLLAVHEREPVLHRLLDSDAPHPPDLHACVLALEESLVRDLEAVLRRAPEVCVPEPHTAAHLLVQCVESLTHRFVHHAVPPLARADFLAEVAALARGYLRERGV